MFFNRQTRARLPAGAIRLGITLDDRGKSALDSLEIEMNDLGRALPWFADGLRDIGHAEATRKNPGIRRRLTPGKKRVTQRRRR